MTTCPKCKHSNQDGVQWCGQCGWELNPPRVRQKEGAPPPRATPAVKAELDPTPPPKGRTLLAFFSSMVIAPASLLPAGMAMAFGAPVEVAAIIGFASWIGGACVVSTIIAGRHWTMPRSMMRAFGVYVGAQVVLGVFGALLIMVIVMLAGLVFKNASCPHIYSHDGQEYRLDADPLSGAFQRGAERDDLVRLDHAREEKGRYRLEVRDELPEKDTLDHLALVVVDHDAATEALPTQEGKILGVTAAAPPVEARDGSGADRRAELLAADDGAFVSGDGGETATMTLTFATPEKASAYALALRAHNTPFAEEALVRYLATMGPGLGKLMGYAEHHCCYAFRDRIHDEIRKLGLPLYLDADTGEGFHQIAQIDPVGPAIQRTQAVAIPAVTGKEVRLRLRWTPRFWAIDQARLGAAAELTPTATLRPTVAEGPSGSLVDLLGKVDGERVTLSRGQAIALEFQAPAAPPEGHKRTVLAQMRGYYEMDYGDGWWINPGAILLHDSGIDSLPSFARRLARVQPDLVKIGVR